MGGTFKVLQSVNGDTTVVQTILADKLIIYETVVYQFVYLTKKMILRNQHII